MGWIKAIRNSMALGLLAFSAASAWGQNVRMLPRAELPVRWGGEVHLGDVAVVAGVDAATAEKLAQTVVVSKLTQQTRVRAEDVLLAVLAQGGDPMLAARVQVSGAAECVVTAADDSSERAPAAELKSTTSPTELTANRPLSVDANKPAKTVVEVAANDAPKRQIQSAEDARTAGTGETLRDLLIKQVVDELRVKRDDVKVIFDTTSPLLLQKTAAGQTWQTRPLTRGYLGTVQWEAQLVQPAGTANRMITKLTVQARVAQRMQGLVTTGVIAKGEVVTPSQVTLEERWVDRKFPTWLAKTGDVVGFEALRAIAAGNMVDQRDFKPLEMATRGDVVTVYFISAGLKVKSTARALDSGKLHDRIAVRNEATGERYEATVIGTRMLAVGAVDPKIEQQLREAR